jgi:acetyltransferase-like isoleucine patch superfamily enzyme
MNSVTQFYIRKFNPVFKGFITRLIYFGSNVKIGKNFRCDSIPRIMIDKSCHLIIGNNVEFRRNIELRVHGTSKIQLHNNIRIDRGVRILAANKANINIQDGTRIGLYTVLNGGDSISIGKKALISGFVYLQTSMHGFKNKQISVQEQGYNHKPVVLENDTWLGTHVVIMPGVTVGTGSVVGSNSVVTKTVLPYKVMGGIPAIELKNRE